MLTIVMRLEERDAEIELEHDAPDAPHVARLRPAQFENDFGRTIVSRRDDRAVMFMVECRAAKINQSNIGGLDAADLSILRKRRE